MSTICRFCAKEQPELSIIDLKTDKTCRQSVMQKLTMFSKIFVDFYDKNLPETICTRCYNLLTISFNFSIEVRRSQVVLNELCNVDVKGFESDKDPITIKEEYIPSLNNLTDEEDTKGDSDSVTEVPISWTSYPWSCSHCNTLLPSMQALMEHSQECHGTCYGFQCADCDVKMDNFRDFVQHVRSEREELIKYCEYCNIKMESPAHTDTHILDHTCTQCGQIFDNISYLQIHRNKYLAKPAEAMMFIVETCKNIETKKNITNFDISSNSVGTVDSNITFEGSHTIKTDISRQKGKRHKTKNTKNIPNCKENILNSSRNPTDCTKNDPEYTKNISDCAKNILNDTKYTPDCTKNIPDCTNNIPDCTKNIPGGTNNISDFIENISDFTTLKIEKWSQYPKICQFCGYYANSDESAMFKRHCLKSHKRCFAMKCIDCSSDEIDTFEQFVEHVQIHRPILKNLCPHCDLEITDFDDLHVLTHASRNQCSICAESFIKKQYLRRHDARLENPVLEPPLKQGRSEPITEDDLTCDICGKRWTTPRSLKHHKIIHTERKRNHTCETCGKAFYEVSALMSHRKLHVETLKETCKICNKSFRNLQRLRYHITTHKIPELMRFQCDYCNKTFALKGALAKHIKYVHIKYKKSHECSYCGRHFGLKNSLKIHLNQHTGARPFSCDICNMNFACWSNCNKHMRRIHGRTIAKTVRTAHGYMPVDPATGKPNEVNITNVVKDWSRDIMELKPRKKKNQKSDICKNDE